MGGTPVSASASLAGSKADVARNWQCFLEVLGWWEMKRCFNYQGNTVILKPAADIVALHPVGRYAQAITDSQ